MQIISITGGVGSGKSEVLRGLQEEFDAEIIKADEVAHQLMEPGKKGYQHVVEALGDSFLNKDGSIDRKKLAALIFQNKEAVETMNAIIHPMAWEEIRYAINHSDKEIIVVEAALYDDEHNAMFDEIWYVYTSVENMSIGHKGMLYAARCMAEGTKLLLETPDKLTAAWEEFKNTDA